MSHAVSYFCDICKGEIDPLRLKQITIMSGNFLYGEGHDEIESIDLCPFCYEKLKNFAKDVEINA